MRILTRAPNTQKLRKERVELLYTIRRLSADYNRVPRISIGVQVYTSICRDAAVEQVFVT